MFLHPVERLLIDKAVVTHETDNAIPPLQTVSRPAEELHIGVIQLGFEGSLGIFGVCTFDPSVNYFVLPVLVVVVLVLLTHVVRGIAYDDSNRGPLLPFNALRVFLGYIKVRLTAFRKVERIHKAQALEGRIGSRQLVIGVLDS